MSPEFPNLAALRRRHVSFVRVAQPSFDASPLFADSNDSFDASPLFDVTPLFASLTSPLEAIPLSDFLPTPRLSVQHDVAMIDSGATDGDALAGVEGFNDMQLFGGLPVFPTFVNAGQMWTIDRQTKPHCDPRGDDRVQAKAEHDCGEEEPEEEAGASARVGGGRSTPSAAKSRSGAGVLGGMLRARGVALGEWEEIAVDDESNE
ncbi:hypothetical protein C8J57DRAFT_1224880 [Mycena rebaudengoi]|nr:hypothetical protein C8J57DRAFT_1224880 [Mycena rebaudengoi]